jgi:hypothetical protein
VRQDTAFGYKGKPTDAERVAFLFDRYQRYTSLFLTEQPGKKRGRAARTRSRGTRSHRVDRSCPRQPGAVGSAAGADLGNGGNEA